MKTKLVTTLKRKATKLLKELREEKGFIDNPKNKNKSVMVTKEGRRRAEELFKTHFGE